MPALLRWVPSVVLFLAQIQAPSAPPRPADWALVGNGKDAYTIEAAGDAMQPGGATLSLRCVNSSTAGFGTASTKAPADSFRGRRVKLSGKMLTTGAKGGASLWLRVDRDTEIIQVDTGAPPQTGDTDWTERAVTLPVPAQATSIVFGVMLQPGGGSVTVRDLRLEAGAELGPPAPAALKVLDAAITIVKNNAWKAASVNWDVAEPEVRGFAAGAERSSEVYPAIRMMLGRLGDRHSFLMPPAQTTAFKAAGAQNPPAEVRALSDGVGYIKVPAYGGSEATAMRTYATRLHSDLTAAMDGARCGWIVDLRTNTGGNMWPMLDGLQPLLGTGVLGTFEGPKGAGTKWIAGARTGVVPPATLKTLESAWVAVLTGPKTASSGEAVAVAFRGRPNTRSFGLPTAGLSTSNGTFPLPDGAMILLTTSVDADRTGRRYGDKIDPDERVEAGDPTTAGGDATLSAAIKWLTQSSGCKGSSR